MRGSDHAAADVERRDDYAIGGEPLEREHRADDVDDRVDRPDFVQVNAIERGPVNGGLGLAQPPEHRDRPGLARVAEGRAANRRLDLLQRMMRRMVMMIMPVMFTFMFLSYPSGLVIYWTISNLWAIGQQYLTTSLVAPVKPKS